MDKFLELSFKNHISENDKVIDHFYSMFDPMFDEMRKYLSKDIADDIENQFVLLATEAFVYSGVEGMKLAIGVINGTIKQVIEI